MIPTKLCWQLLPNMMGACLLHREILSLKDALAAALAGTRGQAAASQEAVAKAVEAARR